MAIYFYDSKDPYYEFSNFDTKHPFELDGKVWASAEQYFQAQKYYIPNSPRHMEYFNIIYNADSPTKVFMLGRQQCKGGYAAKWVVNKKTDTRLVNDVIRMYKDLQIVDDWSTLRFIMMKRALFAKFDQHASIRTMLLNTKSAEIIENSPRDAFWGIGKDGDGKNHLGKLLMEIREEFNLMM
jgi:ribA/ribD-fused uncharacterized protein